MFVYSWKFEKKVKNKKKDFISTLIITFLFRINLY
jgi:hypothetical protein